MPYAKKWDKEFGKDHHYENMAYTKALMGLAGCTTRICSLTKTNDEAIKFLKVVRDDAAFEEYYAHGNLKKAMNFKRRIFVRLLHGRHYGFIRLIKRFYR